MPLRPTNWRLSVRLCSTVTSPSALAAGGALKWRPTPVPRGKASRTCRRSSRECRFATARHARGHVPGQGDGGLTVVLARLVITFSLASHPWTHWHPPQWWLRQAACIHVHEGAWHDKRNPYDRGGFQFAWSTWRTVGGVGDPADASPSEQTYRAWLWWKRIGHHLGTKAGWPNSSRACGLN